ncbi:acyltransferase domain-containing protein [Catenulispora sp. NF23]|uniref:type I polyketide synthase n=1 Tax=Catenulispora pinistramenti TaxID=2705254 RepID=UPI001BAAF229|nr:acyltransferase domain-containing protein [Catenulispora pinistramenti]
MAVLLPGAPDLDAYWRNLVAGTDCITDVPAHRWDPEFHDPAADPSRPDRIYCRRGGFVDGLTEFDPLAYGIMPDSVAGAEPDQLLALRVAADAIADAGGRDRLPAGDRVGVILGRGGYLTPGLVRLDQRVRTANQLVRTLRELIPGLAEERLDAIQAAFTETLGPNRPEAAIGLVPNLAASRIANRLDLRGPAYTVDAACASSLVAVDQAVGELVSGRCDVMLAGGVHHCHDITFWSVFSQLGALSRTGRIRPFHRGADGILIGEGTGVVVLKRLADAQAAGDRVYAVIRGTGVASDGRSASLLNPEPAGQMRAVRAAWAAAGLDPLAADAIGLLEAHGTATPAGDRAELLTIAEVFGPARNDDEAAGGAPALGSVKSMIGHTMPAAGIASLVKAALAVHHGVLPPTLHCEDPHPDLKGTRFRTLAEAEDWPETGTPRRAGVNAFGFGGINAHVVLEQAPDRPRRRRGAVGGVVSGVVDGVVDGGVVPEREVRLAAGDLDALAQMLDAVESERDPGSFSQRGTGAYRIALIDPTPRSFKLARRVIANAKPWRGRGDLWFTPRPLLAGSGGESGAESGAEIGTESGVESCVEPGAEPGAESGFESGADRIAFVFPGLEVDFAPRVDDVAARLGVSGPGYGADSVGSHGLGVFEVGRLLERALTQMGIRPAAVAGHSVGEWTAMAGAGMFAGSAVDDFVAGFDPDSLRVPGLVFGAVGAGAERVAALLPRYPGIVLSHDNGPNQCVVCGPEETMAELLRELRRQNVLCQVLPFRSGFHTPMLEPYLGPILEAFEHFEVRAPTVPVWSATLAAPFPTDAEQVRRVFVRHLVETVRFRQTIEGMYEAGIRAFVQVGTGALATVIGDVLGERDHLAIAANAPQRDGLAQLRRVAAAFWAEGFETSDGLFGGRAKTSAKRRSAPTQLDLGGALVGLGERAAGLVPAASGLTGRDELDELDGLAARYPMAAEVALLLRETAASTGAVLAARQAAASSAASPASASASASASVSASASASVSPSVSASGERRITLAVDTDSMPYLLDHCFFAQRDDWPDVTDRFPVVPATTVIQHMIDAAGGHAIAVRDARFDQWTAAAPPTSVAIVVRPDENGAVKVEFGPYARATIERAAIETGPGFSPAPPAWPVEPVNERSPSIAARTLYDDRWMFHGPVFRGVEELTAIGDRHVRGVISALATPGAILDNVGQLLGYWVMDTLPDRTVVFPMGMKRIVFHGPTPRESVACHIRIRSVEDTVVVADAQLVSAGRVWAEISGWTDRRFGSHPDTKAVERDPGGALLACRRPGGWFAVFDRWTDPASRQLRMRSYLGAAERDLFEARPPRGRRQWLLGRIAVKDAVRQAIWDEDGRRKLFPAEITVGNDEAGRPLVSGTHGRALPPFAVSIAHAGDVGVAIVRPTAGDRRPQIGIDVEVVAARDAATLAFALSEDELTRLRGLVDLGGEGEDLWFARFWTAKEAVAKALGTGLAGNPRHFGVVGATASGAVVEVRGGSAGVGRHFRVRLEQLANPDDLPARQYVVAWTEGPDTDNHQETDT